MELTREYIQDQIDKLTQEENAAAQQHTRASKAAEGAVAILQQIAGAKTAFTGMLQKLDAPEGDEPSPNKDGKKPGKNGKVPPEVAAKVAASYGADKEVPR